MSISNTLYQTVKGVWFCFVFLLVFVDCHFFQIRKLYFQNSNSDNVKSLKLVWSLTWDASITSMYILKGLLNI